MASHDAVQRVRADKGMLQRQSMNAQRQAVDVQELDSQRRCQLEAAQHCRLIAHAGLGNERQVAAYLLAHATCQFEKDVLGASACRQKIRDWNPQIYQDTGGPN